MFYYSFIDFWVFISQTSTKSLFQSKAFTTFITLLMFVVIILIVFLNPTTIDMARYVNVFKLIGDMTWQEAIEFTRWEPGFITYQWILSKIFSNENVFIIISIIVIFGLLIYSIRKVIKFKYIPLIIFCNFSFFYFYNFTMNVLRQGIAVSLIFLFIILLGFSKYKRSIMLLLIAITF